MRRQTPREYRLYYPQPPPSPAHPIEGRSCFFAKLSEASFDMHFPVEVGIVLRGQMERYFRTAKRRIDPGQVWFCGVWEPHGWRVTKAPCEMVYLLVYPPLLAGLWFEEAPRFNWMAPFVAAARRRPQFHAAQRARGLELARALKRALAGEKRWRRLRLRILLMELLVEIHEGREPLPARGFEAARSFKRIDNALQLVFQTGSYVSQERAAAACHTNRKTFGRMFRELMGIPFAKFALRYRLGSAARGLTQTDEPIKAIAARWGFSDISHFYRCFRSHYGCTPNEFRENRGPLH